MKITINRTPEEHAGEFLTVRQILDSKGWNFPLLIVRVDGMFVERKDYETTLVRDGAEVDVIHLMSGG